MMIGRLVVGKKAWRPLPAQPNQCAIQMAAEFSPKCKVTLCLELRQAQLESLTQPQNRPEIWKNQLTDRNKTQLQNI